MVTCRECPRQKYDIYWCNVMGRWEITCVWHTPAWRMIAREQEARDIQAQNAQA